MGIFSRLTDIINSNINSILDHAEDPEKVIRLVIQEMEDTLVEVRSTAARAIADQKDVERKIKKLQAMRDEWQRKAELALSKDREDLARGALAEKAKVAEMIGHYEEEIGHLKDALGRHEEDIVKLETKLREARAKKATIEARTKTATSSVRVKKNLYDSRLEDAFVRFDKIDTRLDRIEGEAEAMEMGREKTLADEIDELANDDAIGEELEALKASMAKKNKPKK